MEEGRRSTGQRTIAPAMTDEQMAQVLAALRAGKEFSVCNQDGVWGIRSAAGAFEVWSRVPYEPDQDPTPLTEEGVRAHLGGWELDRVLAHLR